MFQKRFDNDGYIDVGDGCWRQNVLVTTLRCWWRFWQFDSPTSCIFYHKRRAPTTKRCHQNRNSVTNSQKLSPTSLVADNDLPVEKIWGCKNDKRQPRFTLFAFEVLSMKFWWQNWCWRQITCRSLSLISMLFHRKRKNRFKTFLNDAKRNKFAVNPISLQNHN